MILELHILYRWSFCTETTQMQLSQLFVIQNLLQLILLTLPAACKLLSVVALAITFIQSAGTGAITCLGYMKACVSACVMVLVIALAITCLGLLLAGTVTFPVC